MENEITAKKVTKMPSKKTIVTIVFIVVFSFMTIALISCAVSRFGLNFSGTQKVAEENKEKSKDENSTDDEPIIISEPTAQGKEILKYIETTSRDDDKRFLPDEDGYVEIDTFDKSFRFKVPNGYYATRIVEDYCTANSITEEKCNNDARLIESIFVQQADDEDGKSDDFYLEINRKSEYLEHQNNIFIDGSYFNKSTDMGRYSFDPSKITIGEIGDFDYYKTMEGEIFFGNGYTFIMYVIPVENYFININTYMDSSLEVTCANSETGEQERVEFSNFYWTEDAIDTPFDELLTQYVENPNCVVVDPNYLHLEENVKKAIDLRLETVKSLEIRDL